MKNHKDASPELILNFALFLRSEIYIWYSLSLIIFLYSIYDVFQFPEADILTVISINRTLVSISFSLVLFPYIFKYIFNHFPLEFLRARYLENKARSSDSEDVSIEQFLSEEYSRDSAENYLSKLAVTSKLISENIYSRSGVYLLIGVLIAFSGLLFFYFQSADIKTSDNSEYLSKLAPRFGILFFIEFVAFFFLNQYKSSMNEYRYYESLKRTREETLALIKISKDKSFNNIDLFDLVQKAGFRSNSGILENGQTTEFLESKKLINSELELAKKIIEVVEKEKRM